jgi:hypothetical protein
MRSQWQPAGHQLQLEIRLALLDLPVRVVNDYLIYQPLL